MARIIWILIALLAFLFFFSSSSYVLANNQILEAFPIRDDDAAPASIDYERDERNKVFSQSTERVHTGIGDDYFADDTAPALLTRLLAAASALRTLSLPRFRYETALRAMGFFIGIVGLIRLWYAVKACAFGQRKPQQWKSQPPASAASSAKRSRDEGFRFFN